MDKAHYQLDKLKAERPGILNWLLDGLRQWLADGKILNAPKSVQAKTLQYREESDPLKDFFDEDCCFESYASVRVIDLRNAYEKYCQQAGIKNVLPPRPFNEILRSHGCIAKVTKIDAKSVKCWHGIDLNESEL